jgi:hypothetical protein
MDEKLIWVILGFFEARRTKSQRFLPKLGITLYGESE